MEKLELVFIPFPVIGHLVSTVEIGKLLARRDHRLSITVLVIKFPSNRDSARIQSLEASITELPIRFVHFPLLQHTPSGPGLPTAFLAAHIPLVRDAVQELTRSDSGRLAGFVLDMLSTPFIDVANEFGVPSYMFFTSGAAYLGFMLHLQFLYEHRALDIAEIKGSDAELEIPSYANSVPIKVFPGGFFDEEGGVTQVLMAIAKKWREAKGIMVNTFVELESHAINSLSSGAIPPVYPVGPILNTQVGAQSNADVIMSWLDDQPHSSVVFLCFGSRGSFKGHQVKEIAHGLEQSGYRFLWSLRHDSSQGNVEFPVDDASLDKILPEGFLDRMGEIGKIIGWAPQMAILAHPAVGGFVSHCGWNSTLESMWHGVPLAAWPMFAEQQLNAFLMIKDLELAVEIKMDYYKDSDNVVNAKDIEKGIRCLMDNDGKQRKKMKEMQEKCRNAMMEGGSFNFYLGKFIDDVITKIENS